MTVNRSSAGAHPRLRSSLALLALVPTALVAAGGGVAVADTVTNNVTVGGNDTTTVGSTTSVAYTLTATNDPGEPGHSAKCNAKDTSPVTVSVQVTVPNGTTATISPSSLSFTDCTTAKAVSLGASKAGDFPVTVTTSAANVATTAASFTLKVKPIVSDTTGPVLTLPSDQVVEAASGMGAPLSYTATAFDTGDARNTAVTCTPASGSTFALGATTVGCSSSDSKGNTSTGAFKVNVVDSSGPVLSLTDTVAEATGAEGAKVSFAATALDAVDGATAVTCSPVPGSQFALGTTTVSCSSTDTRTNKSTGTLKVTVQDKTAPSLSLSDKTVEATSADGAPVSYTATASDLVDGSVTPSCDRASGSTFALGSTTVTCTATDKVGNKATGTFSVAVGDRTAPTLTLTDNTVEATAPDGADVAYNATANDAVDGALTPSCAPGSGTTFALGTTEVTCSVSDSRNNTAMGSLKVTVQDTTPPALTLSDKSAEATGPNGAVVNYTASAKDLVSGTVAVACDKASGAVFALGATTVSCSATDGAGKTGTGSFVVTVRDTTAPTVALSNKTAEATSAQGAAVTYDASATDLVDGSLTPTCTPASGSTFPLGDSTVTCSAVDAKGNKATDTLTVTVTDKTAPALSVSSETVEATGPTGAKADYVATAADLVDGSITPSCDIASGTTLALGKHTITCTATDSRRNFETKTFQITVVDTTAPEVTATDKTAEATGPEGAVVTFVAGAKDAVSGVLPVTCTPSSGSTFGIGTTPVSCSAKDGAGNTGTGSANITVRDTTGPALTLTSQTLEATGPTGAAATFAPTASDLVSGDRDVTCDKTSGSTFPIGVTVVNCSAADAAGNPSKDSFTITVGDKTAPSLTLVDAKAEATKPEGADVSYAASASDIVDGTRPVTCNPASGSTFAITVTSVSCSASDTRNNTATGTLKVTVTDTTGPSLTLTDQKAEATSPQGAAVTYTTSASDLVDGVRDVTCDAASGSTFELGVTTVSCWATDGRGNEGAGTFSVTVTDGTAPTLVLPADLKTEASSANGAAVTYAATATDIVDVTAPVICTPASGSTFALGTAMVDCSATDKAGNKATGSFKVTVLDTTAPNLVLGNVTAEATSAAGAPVSYTATAADAVDGATAVSCTPASGSTFKFGETVVSCGTADKAGNEATGEFTVTVQDTQAPVLAKPGNISLTATSAAGAVATYAPTATDAVDGTVPATCTPASGSTFALGVTQVSCTATDKAKNASATQVFTVSVSVPWSKVLQPLNADGSSVYKIGSTIPVKFTLGGTAAGITNLPAKLYYAKVSNNLPGTEAEALATTGADTGNLFRYDATSKQYIFNLSTKGFSEGTYQLRIDLGDGVPHTVNITSRK